MSPYVSEVNFVTWSRAISRAMYIAVVDTWRKERVGDLLLVWLVVPG